VDMVRDFVFIAKALILFDIEIVHLLKKLFVLIHGLQLPAIKRLGNLKSLRYALEREATLAGFLLCDPCPMDLGSGHLHQLRNVTRSSRSEVGLIFFGVRLGPCKAE